MESTDGTNVVNNQNNYGEVDNYSETSKEYASSNSSFVDETKKRNSLISFEDDKDKDNNPNEKEVNVKTKRSKRNSFIKLFSKDKEEKEGGLSRSFSLFKEKDKDNKRSSKTTGEKHSRSTSRASSNNDAPKSRLSFLSDDLEIDTTLNKGTKSRRRSNPEIVERDSPNKRANRLSVNLGSLHISKIFKGSDENKPSQKPVKPLEDIFLEPDETMTSPKSPKSSSPFLKNKQDDYVESPQNIHHVDSIRSFSRDDSKNNFTDESPNDDVQSINSSTRPSSLDDHFYNPDDDDKTDEPTSPTSPNTPRLIITRLGEQDHKSDDIEDSIMESKEFKRRNIKINTNITDDDDDDTTHISNKDSNFISFRDDAETVNNVTDEQILKKLQDLENINKSLNDAKAHLEAKVAEQDDQIDKFNSVEQIIQQQIDLSKRMTETMHRLESKTNAQNEELDSSNVGKVFENTIKRLEDKIDKQNEEIGQLKSIVGQLTGNPQFFLASGDLSQFRIEDQKLIMSHQEEENQSLIQTNQSQACSNTLVNTLVVSPICMSATIAASVLHAVYVRPVIGLIRVVKEISTAGRDLVIVT